MVGRGFLPVRSSYKTIGLWVILIILFVENIIIRYIYPNVF